MSDLRESVPPAGPAAATSEEYSIQPAIVGLVATAIVLLVSVGWSLHTARQYLFTQHARQSAVQDLTGQIRHLDEVLTMSSRMAAATGDMTWAERYHSYEPLLDDAIKALIAISPKVFATTLGDETDDANQQLVAMENEAIDHVARGELAAAHALLFSEAYEVQKARYAEGWMQAESALRTTVAIESTALARRLTILASLSAAAGVVLAAGVLRLGTARVKLRSQVARERMEAAEATTRAKSEFLANMSHEIRTPMTAIVGYAELLADPHQPDGERMSCIEIIRRNGEHLITVVNDILDLSKIEAGKMTVERIECAPLQVLHDVISLMRVRATGQGLSVRTEFSFPLPKFVQTDPVRLRQVLINLVGNAIKFTERGEIVVAVSLQQRNGDGVLRFDIRDTGIGMTRQQVDALFNAFSQADGSTTRRFGGTGLGLVISRRLAQMLGGEISVESAAGVGSVFTFTISTGPIETAMLARHESEITVVTHAEAHSSTIGDVRLVGRILLAEDGLDNQRLIRFHLERAGADVTVVENGRIALDTAMAAGSGEGAYGLILMDMQMPEMDGYAATRSLRRLGYARPIIALTAHAMSGDRERCLAAGCDEHLTKPIDKARLLAACAAALDRADTPCPSNTPN